MQLHHGFATYTAAGPAHNGGNEYHQFKYAAFFTSRTSGRWHGVTIWLLIYIYILYFTFQVLILDKDCTNSKMLRDDWRYPPPIAILKFQKTCANVSPAKILIFSSTGKINVATDLRSIAENRKVPSCRTEATNENRVFVVLMAMQSLVLRPEENHATPNIYLVSLLWTFAVDLGCRSWVV